MTIHRLAIIALALLLITAGAFATILAPAEASNFHDTGYKGHYMAYDSIHGGGISTFTSSWNVSCGFGCSQHWHRYWFVDFSPQQGHYVVKCVAGTCL